MSFSIILTDEEKEIVESYSKIHSISIAEAFKNALFERIEDEYDLAISEEAYNEYMRTRESRPIEEFWKELDI